MNELIEAADLCVKCGLCLPHCPTYHHQHNENESPRGRIALIQAVASGELAATKNLVAHIDNCLLCRACERACPAEVPYHQLVDGFRSHYHQHSLGEQALQQLAQHQALQGLAKASVKLYQNHTAQKIARWLHLDNGPMAYLPPVSPHPDNINASYAARAPVRGTVALFTGCMGELLDAQTLHAAIKVLTFVGFNVEIPSQQGCCGALALHAGDAKTAGALADANSRAFANPDLTAIISVASGCGGHLLEYPDSAVAEKIVDISQFLSVHGGLLTEHLHALPAKVSVHTPCSLKNVLQAETGVIRLLQQLPEVELQPLSEPSFCCGAAGSYMLTHPTLAKALVTDIVEELAAQSHDYVVSANLGCALHISAGLRARGLKQEVLHPVVLIARQLKDAPP